MKIKKNIIILGRAEKALWQVPTSNGPDADAAAARIDAAARALVARLGRDVGVFAPARAGGRVFDVYYHEG